jgi:hypothetical protein
LVNLREAGAKTGQIGVCLKGHAVYRKGVGAAIIRRP